MGDDTFDCSCQVQLVAKGIKLNVKVDMLWREGGLVDVEGMSLLVSGHALIDDEIHINRRSANVDGHESSRGERPAQAGGPWHSICHGIA